MQPTLLADLAVTLAFHGPNLFRSQQKVPSTAVQEYWVAHRCRLEQWQQPLSNVAALQECGDFTGIRRWWSKHESVLDEILISELLTRTVAALGSALDHWQEVDEVSPITDSVLQSHLDARNRVLRLLAYGSGFGLEPVVRLNLLRSTVERWADLLVGYVAAHDASVIRCAVDRRRAISYARDAAEGMLNPGRETSCWLLAMSLRESLKRRTKNEGFALAENQRLADAVLSCLRPDIFDSFGVPKKNWLQRIEQVSDDTEQLFNALTNP